MILQIPHPLLRHRAKIMKAPDPDLEKRMLRACPEDALGLAAPQIGVLRQVVLLRNPETLFIYNLQIETVDEKEGAIEGCLSIPGRLFFVERPISVKWQGRDSSWKRIGGTAEGTEARVLQHEHDHLWGRLLIDHGTEVRAEDLEKL